MGKIPHSGHREVGCSTSIQIGCSEFHCHQDPSCFPFIIIEGIVTFRRSLKIATMYFLVHPISSVLTCRPL